MLSAQPAVLPEIQSASPTLAEIMRSCLLRAGLSRANGLSDVVLGYPKAWLGTICHEVLSKIPEVDSSQETIDQAFERLWNQSMTAQYERAANHPLDRRFGHPTRWPGYYLAFAGARLRARQIAREQEQAGHVGGPIRQADTHRAMREHEFTAYGGKLRGRPDVVREDEIVDYKTGGLYEENEYSTGDALKAAYVRQLCIYAFLVKASLGWWPRRGVLIPLAGPGVEVNLTPLECERDAADAVMLLAKYNRLLKENHDPTRLASSSPDTCKWCPYKLPCPAFWQSTGPSWSGYLDGAAIEGVLLSDPSHIHGG